MSREHHPSQAGRRVGANSGRDADFGVSSARQPPTASTARRHPASPEASRLGSAVLNAATGGDRPPHPGLCGRQDVLGEVRRSVPAEDLGQRHWRGLRRAGRAVPEKRGCPSASMAPDADSARWSTEDHMAKEPADAVERPRSGTRVSGDRVLSHQGSRPIRRSSVSGNGYSM